MTQLNRRVYRGYYHVSGLYTAATAGSMIVTLVKEVNSGNVFVVVCLSVSLLATLPKNFRTDLHEIFRKGWQWANEQVVKFGDPDQRLDTGIVFRIRYYWEIYGK